MERGFEKERKEENIGVPSGLDLQCLCFHDWSTIIRTMEIVYYSNKLWICTFIYLNIVFTLLISVCVYTCMFIDCNIPITKAYS